MTISHLLEDFARDNLHEQGNVSSAILNEERLSSFEQGYQAGWDDSLKASGSNEKQALEEISKAFSELSVSRERIYTELLENMRPLIDGIVDSTLPAILKESLGLQVGVLIHDYIQKHGGGEIIVTVAPGQKEILSKVTNRFVDLPIHFKEVSRIEPSEVKINFCGVDESEIDTMELALQIKSSIDDFFENEVSVLGGESDA